MKGTRTLGKIVGTGLYLIQSFFIYFAFNLLVNKEKIYSYELTKEEYHKVDKNINEIIVKLDYLLYFNYIFCSSEINCKSSKKENLCFYHK